MPYRRVQANACKMGPSLVLRWCNVQCNVMCLCNVRCAMCNVMCLCRMRMHDDVCSMHDDAYEVLRNASLFLDLMHEMTKEID